MTSDNSRQRLGLLAVTALTLFGALFARLWFLQVVEGDTLNLQAEGNATEEVIIPADRGKILDRNGVVLVDNRESIVVGIEAQSFNELTDDEQEVVLLRLSDTLSLDRPPAEALTPEVIRRKLADPRYSPLRPVPIVDDITEEEEIYFSEQAAQFPSVVVERTTVRDYPYGSLAAHVLGYVGALNDTQWEKLEDNNNPDKPYNQTDDIGRSGVEAQYEEYLRGKPGQQVFEVDRRGNVVKEITSERVEPRPGEDLYLSIDARVQAETELALSEGLARRQESPGELGYFPAEAGAAAIVDPQDGQVVAMASYPTYDPADLVGGIGCATWRDLQGLEREGTCGDEMEAEIEDLEEPPVSKLLNRAIQGTYPAGSTFKLASAYAGLNLGLITPQTTINDPGYFLIPGCAGDADSCRVSSPSAESGGVGPVALERALTVSSDTYFYKLGNDSWAIHKQDQVGPTAFQDEVEKLGFDAKTGIDLPSESSGRIPNPDWLVELDIAINGGETEAGRWGSGNSINMAIGQGDVLVTPLQIANAYAAFANGGTLYQPQLLNRVTEPGQPEAVTVVAEPKEIRTIDWGVGYDDMMRGFEGVTRGDDSAATGARAFAGFPQETWSVAGKTGTAEQGTELKPKEDHSWFVGFGPTNELSRYSAAMVMESAGAGGSASGPAVREILEAIALGELDLSRLNILAAANDVNAGATGSDEGNGTSPTSSTTSTTEPTAGGGG